MSLIARLTEGRHPVVLEPRITDVEQIIARIKDKFVFIKFTDTQGGTELGIQLDAASQDISSLDLLAKSIPVRLTGNCTLNFVDVICNAEVDLVTRKGVGYLQLA